MKVWLDDVRPMPEGFDFWAKNAEDINFLICGGKVKHISFDHDLGIGFNGYDVAKAIERMAAEKLIDPISWDIHSANPEGRRYIEQQNDFGRSHNGTRTL